MYRTSLAEHASGASMPHAPRCTCECDVHGIWVLDLGAADGYAALGCDVACAWSSAWGVVEAACAFLVTSYDIAWLYCYL
jgi:hypothetical protein